MSATGSDIAALREAARRAEADGSSEQARQLLRQALALNPGDGTTIFALAELLTRMGQLAEAETEYAKLLQAFPNEPALLNSVGVLLQKAGRRQEAIGQWRKVAALRPALAAPHVNIGLALRDGGDLGGAIAALEHARALEPASFDAHYNLGCTYYHAGQLEPALASLDASMALKPDHGRAAAMLAQASQAVCDWDRLDQLMPMLRAEAARAVAGKPCAISPWFSVRLPLSGAERKAIAEVTTGAVVTTSPTFAVQRGPRERLTIGYMAQDFRDHPGLYLTAGLYRRHDRARFRVHAYPVKTPDAFGASILADGCDLVRDLSALSDTEAAGRIHADGVDILVDLSVVGVFNRQGILRLRPAPIQVSWLGFAGTMSGHLYDYLIGDAVVTPPAHEKDYLEQIARLPASYQINNRDQALGPVPTRESEGLPEAGFIFACFCSADRIERDVFARWMSILRQCPGSVLWLLGSSTTLQANLRRRAEQDGVEPSRLVFAARQMKAAHLGRFALADLHLDTGTFGAHTTGSDALWAGVPLLTKIGDGFPSRVGASLLHAVGMPELIAPDWDSYERLAADLAQHPDKLAALKQKLAANRLTQPLFDTDRSVRDLESLYESLWSAKR